MIDRQGTVRPYLGRCVVDRPILKFQCTAMTLEPREERTTIATLRRVRQDLLEIYYHDGCVLSVEHLAEVQEMRRRMMGSTSYGTLTIIPEDVDFHMDAMRTDHLGPDRSLGRVIATAVVAKASLIERLIHVYFKYYPQLQRILVTDNEAEARAWITTQLESSSETGS